MLSRASSVLSCSTHSRLSLARGSVCSPGASTTRSVCVCTVCSSPAAQCQLSLQVTPSWSDASQIAWVSPEMGSRDFIRVALTHTHSLSHIHTHTGRRRAFKPTQCRLGGRRCSLQPPHPPTESLMTHHHRSVGVRDAERWQGPSTKPIADEKGGPTDLCSRRHGYRLYPQLPCVACVES